MSTGSQKRQRKRSTRVRRDDRPAAQRPIRLDADEATGEAAREHYRREKERRAAQTRPPEHPLEQARRAYHALLAADAERARGGRPKKGGAPVRKPKAVASDSENEG